MMTLTRAAVSAALLAVLTFGLTGPAAAELPRKPYLPLETALKMIDACIAVAAEEGWAMHVAVKDTGDDLKAYARMDGAGLDAQRVAMKKASASATTRWSTAQIAEYAFNDAGQPTPMAFLEGMPLIAGGVPIMSADGVQLGGIGVSGGRPDQDETCANAALEAVKSDLK